MTHETDPKSMPVETLAQRCAQETRLYFKSKDHDTKFCFELFRRAVSERDGLAWNAIILQYRPLVARWVNRWADRHPDFALAREDGEDFIDESFIRFWNHFTSDKFSKSSNLDSVLQYLKLCVNSTLEDIRRKMHRRRFDQTLESDDEGEARDPADPRPTPEETLQSDELWQLIQTRLKDKKEFTVVYASFNLNLSPRQIIAEYPNVFRDINEVYQCKANVWARLGRDPELREFVQP